MPVCSILRSSIAVLSLFGISCKTISAAPGDEPKPTPENTISIQLGDPVPAQKFDHSPKFFIAGVTDRSGNPQPLLVMKARGGIFLDKQPTAIMKDALEQSLKAGNLLAADEASADLVLRVYLFQFGLASGSGLDFFGKVEFSAMVKNPKTGESLEAKAAGTSIANGAIRKKNMQKNVEQDIEAAVRDATRNFLRGTQLKEAVAALSKGAEGPPASAPGAIASSQFSVRILRIQRCSREICPVLSRLFPEARTIGSYRRGEKEQCVS